MKISKKAYYGLRAVLALAQAKEPLSIHSIAKTEHLPEDYLEKILQTLRREGIVEAKKGTTGGYVLARPIETISTWDILKILDGPIAMFTPYHVGTTHRKPAKQVSSGKNTPLSLSKPDSTKRDTGFMPPVKGELPCLQVSHCQTNQVWRTLEEAIEKTLAGITLENILPKSKTAISKSKAQTPK